MIRRTLLSIAFLCGSVAAIPAAENEPRLVDTDETPTLFVNASVGCNEDYAAELRRAGIETTVREFASLRAMVKFVGVPEMLDAKHILLIDGVVVANHVSPEVIAKMVRERPGIAGVIGAAGCAADVDHGALDGEPVRFF